MPLPSSFLVKEVRPATPSPKVDPELLPKQDRNHIQASKTSTYLHKPLAIPASILEKQHSLITTLKTLLCQVLTPQPSTNNQSPGINQESQSGMEASAGMESSASIPNSNVSDTSNRVSSVDATPALLKAIKFPRITLPSIPASIITSGGVDKTHAASTTSTKSIVTQNIVQLEPTAPPSTTITSTETLVDTDVINQESYYGLIDSVQDAMLVIQAAKCDLLPRVRERLSDVERKSIRSGSVFVFLESESRIRRWTDGKIWSPSRISGEFLVYREQDANDKQLPSGLSKKTIGLNLATKSMNGAGMVFNNNSAVYSSETFHLVAYFRDQDKPKLGELAPSRVSFFTGNPALLPSLMQSILPPTLDAAPIQPTILPRSTTPTSASQQMNEFSASQQVNEFFASQQMNELTGHFRLTKRHIQQSLSTARRGVRNAQKATTVAIAPRSQSLPPSNHLTKRVNYVASAAIPSAEDQLLFTHFLSSLHASSSNPHSSGTDSVEHPSILSTLETKRPFEAIEKEEHMATEPEEDAQ